MEKNQFKYLGDVPYNYAHAIDIQPDDIVFLYDYRTSPNVNHQMMVKVLNENKKTIILPLTFFDTYFMKISIEDFDDIESQCNHTIEWVSDDITAYGGMYKCSKCGYIKSVEDGR